MEASNAQKNPLVPAANYIAARLPALKGFIRNEAHKSAVMAGLYANMKKIPKLAECDPDSLFMGVAFCLQLDLPIGAPRGGITLIPFGKTVTPVIDYRGMEKLAYRSGKVTSIKAVPVIEGEVFDWTEGTDAKIVHIPRMDAPRQDYSKMVAVYAVAEMTDGGSAFKVLSKQDVEFYKEKSPSWKKPDSPWQNFPVAMAQKTAILRLCNDLPHLDERLNLAVEHEMRVEAGIPTDNLVEGVTDITPVSGENPPPPEPGMFSLALLQEQLQGAATFGTEALDGAWDALKAEYEGQGTDDEWAALQAEYGRLRN